MIQFRDREIVNERLELNSKTELYYLGHNLTLRGCTLVLRVPARALVISKVQFIGCTIEAKQELKNFRWDKGFLKGCRVMGAFSGNDFGRWPDSEGGGVEDCDFSAARLDACRFIGCDVSTLRFPSWPCFTLLDPVRRTPELKALPWPGDIASIEMDFSEEPPTTVAVTYFAPALAKRSGAREEDIRAVLEKLDGVKF